MPAMMVLRLCKVSCLCRCIVQRLGSADISVLAYNFWQATKASLLWGEAPVQVVSHLCHRIVQWLCVADCKHPCLVRAAAPNSAPARTPGVYAQRLCTMQSQQSIHSPSPRGRGLGFRQGCRDRTPKALQDAKPTKRSYRDREQALF